MSGYDDFIERLEAALEPGEGREDFMDYLQGMSRSERAELLAEAARRGPEGAGRKEAGPREACEAPEDEGDVGEQ